MTDLVQWLRAQLDEDERVAREADFGPWEVGPTFGARDNRVYVRQEGDLIDSIGTCVIAGQVSNMPRFRGNAEHIARHDPARVLRDVEAKRRIVDRHTMKVGEHVTRGICAECGGSDWKPSGADRLDPYPWVMPWPCPTLRLLALPYADRPGYREEWRP